MAADAPRIRRAAAARVTRVRRTLRASGSNVAGALLIPVCQAGTPARMRASIRVAISDDGNMRCFELFDGKHI